MVGQFCLKDLQMLLLYNSCWKVFSKMTTDQDLTFHCTLNPNSGLEKGWFPFVNALILPMRIPFWKISKNFTLAIFCFFYLDFGKFSVHLSRFSLIQGLDVSRVKTPISSRAFWPIWEIFLFPVWKIFVHVCSRGWGGQECATWCCPVPWFTSSNIQNCSL